MWKFTRNNKSQTESRFETELFEALAPSEHDVSRAAGNPFLQRRLMVAIAAEQQRRHQSAAVWSLSFGVVLRATPAMAAIALLFFGLFWFSERPTPRGAPIKAKVVRAEGNPAATSELPLMSNEDLMSIMLAGRTMEQRGEQVR